jgi:nitrite reductase (NADH) large subunit
MTRYLIVGNGVAGTTAAQSIRTEDPNAEITVLTDEDVPFYNRMRLTDWIAGEVTEEALQMKKEAWYRENNIHLELNCPVTDARADEQVLLSADQRSFPYDRLLVATGSRSFIPPIAGSDKSGVFALRTIQDARAISSLAASIQEAVLIGGGLLGLEAGNALRKIGKKVRVVEFFPRLLPRQLDVEGGKRLQYLMEEMGFSFWLGAKTQEIVGTNQVEGVLLEGGERLPAGMVIVSAGVRPRMELADPLGIATDKGIVVDAHLRTSHPNVYAAGDVAQFQGMAYGIWPAALEQGKAAGLNMAGKETAYQGTVMANSLKVVGIDLASAGNIDAEGTMEGRVQSDEGRYRKIVLDQGRIVGCIMLGDTRGFSQVTRAMAEKKDVSFVKDQILTDGFDFQEL